MKSSSYLNAMNLIVIDATNRMGMSPSCMRQLVALMVCSLLFINLNMKRPNKHLETLKRRKVQITSRSLKIVLLSAAEYIIFDIF